MPRGASLERDWTTDDERPAPIGAKPNGGGQHMRRPTIALFVGLAALLVLPVPTLAARPERDPVVADNFTISGTAGILKTDIGQCPQAGLKMPSATIPGRSKLVL